MSGNDAAGSTGSRLFERAFGVGVVDLVVRVVADEGKDGGLWNDEVPVALERDLDGGLAEEQGVVAGTGLHRNEAGLARRCAAEPPRLVVGGTTEIGERKTGSSRDDAATLHRLTVDGGGGQVEPDFRALVAIFGLHEHAVADDEELLVAMSHVRRVARAAETPQVRPPRGIALLTVSPSVRPPVPAPSPVVRAPDAPRAREAPPHSTRAWATLLGAHWQGVLAVAIGLVWLAGAVLPLADYDLGMHLRVGEWIAAHGALPRTEPFAWTRVGAPYLAYSWLAETSYYLLWRAGGASTLQALNGIVLVAGVLAVALFARTARHSAWTTTMLVVAHVVVMELCAPTLRPQGLLAVALPLCWAATARLAVARDAVVGSVVRERVRWPYVVLVGATALAANTHLFAPACGATLVLVLPRVGREWRVLVTAAAAIGLGLLCTPYAAEWGAIYRLYLSPTPLLRFPSPITELTPGVVYLTRGFGAAWLIAPALAMLPWLVRASDTSDVADPARPLVPPTLASALLWLAGLLFFGLAIRGLFVWWLVCLPLAGAALARVPEPTGAGVGRALRLSPLALFAVMAAGNAREGADARAGARSDSPRRLPNPVARGALGLADSLDRIAPGGRGRVVTTFNYGNALLWRLPRYSMSLDGRAVFPDSAIALDVWVRASHRADTLRAPLADADLVLLPDGHTGLAQVARTPGWERVARVHPSSGAAGDTAELWARSAWVRRYGTPRALAAVR